jgi:hypothetical protein
MMLLKTSHNAQGRHHCKEKLAPNVPTAEGEEPYCRYIFCFCVPADYWTKQNSFMYIFLFICPN